MIKKVEVIINPSAGVDSDVLSILDKELKNSNLEYHYSVTTRADDIVKFTKEAIRRKVDAIAVSGGDGTVAEVAKLLHNSNIALLPIPQGSANVIAKEFLIPLDVTNAIKLLTENNFSIKKVDTLKINDKISLLGLNIGYFAKIIEKADKRVKDKVGQFAYIITALSELKNIKDKVFYLNIDGKEIEEEGVSCFIRNIGNVGLNGVDIVPGMSASDGYIDVVVIKKANILALAQWIKGAFTGEMPKDCFKHWKAKEVNVQAEGAKTILLDDVAIKNETFNINIVPNSIRIIVPNN